MKTLLSSLTLLASSMAAPVLAETDNHGLDGSWKSMACEVRPQVGADGGVSEWWLTREIEFENDRIEARFTTFSGSGCSTPLNELGFAGRVDVLGDSGVAEGAIEANLTIDEYVRITPLAQGFADFLNGAGNCGEGKWSVGTPKELFDSGCAILGVEPGKPTIEYEIIARIGDMVYFGARPVDGTFITSPDKRPGALPVPLVSAD